MSVNDLIVQGAKPLIFLDYISINKIDFKKLKSILKGIVKGESSESEDVDEPKKAKHKDPLLEIFNNTIDIIVKIIIIVCESKW